jgi:hypothetical protein
MNSVRVIVQDRIIYGIWAKTYNKTSREHLRDNINQIFYPKIDIINWNIIYEIL